MTRFQRVAVLTLCAVMAAGTFLPTFLSGAAPVRPGAAAAGERSPQAILAEMRVADEQVRTAMPSLLALADPAFRTGEGQKAIVPLKKMAGLFGELEKVVPNEETRDSVRMNRYRILAYAGTLGDKESVTTLETTAKEGETANARSAKAGLSMIQWLNASKDAAAQGKVLEDVTAMAKAQPESLEMAESLGFMANVGAANEDVTKKVIEVIRNSLKGEAAKDLLTQLDAAQTQRELVGKALAVQGRTTTGATFDTASLKGKVVLLDFWATWCGPCIAELPALKKTYEELHPRGLEIVGVNFDTSDETVNTFTKEKEMPWVQLREASQNERDMQHPLGKRFGVEGIPTLFLIDRQGVLRHVDARQNLEEKIKALLAEGGSATAPAAQK